MSRTSTLAVSATVSLASFAAWGDFYVSPTGSDTGLGTKAQPFATVARARDAVRELRQDSALPADGLTVHLRGGTYALDTTLTFTADDSGAPGAPIGYQAAKGEEVWLSGGTTVPATLFRQVIDPALLKSLPPEARGHVLQVRLTDAAVPGDVDQLPDVFSGFTGAEPQLLEVFCNGRQMQCARWPNDGFAKFTEIVDPGSGLRDYVAKREGRLRPGVFRYEGDRPERWDVNRGVWMMGFWARAYVCDAVRAGKIDTAKKEITWAVPLGFGLDTWGANRWYAFNLPEKLDTPGEWYLDRQRGALYFWPPAPMGKCPVLLTRLKEPMVQCTDASPLIFRGIGFEGGRGDAVVVTKGRGVELVGCEIRNVGRDAVRVLGGHEHKVIGGDIHHVGYSGVILSGGDRQTLDPANHEAVNNHVYHTNQVKRIHASPSS